MDNASDYGSEDSRFNSWLARAKHFQLQLEDLLLARGSIDHPSPFDQAMH